MHGKRKNWKWLNEVFPEFIIVALAMSFINIEIKAKCFHPETVEAFLFSRKARFEGIDFQKDTYFNVPDGRLKLRQGNLENNLIFYKRNNNKGPKRSNFNLAAVHDSASLLALLTNAFGEKIVVEKKRKIFYLDNVKIHLDEVRSLGNFIEIEASNRHHPNMTTPMLTEQCEDLMKAFDIHMEDLVEYSYSDMLISNEKNL